MNTPMKRNYKKNPLASVGALTGDCIDHYAMQYTNNQYNIFQKERIGKIMSQIDDLQAEPTIEEIEERIKKNRRDEVIQIYDSLDERKQHLTVVYLRALSGKSAVNY